MRTLTSLMALSLLCTPALARDRSRPSKAQALALDPRLTWVDDEPMSGRALEPARLAPSHPEWTGARRSIALPVLETTPAQVEGAVAERAAAEDPAMPRAEAPAPRPRALSVGVEAIVQREMRAHQAAIDACTRAALRRAPGAHGKLTLNLVVGENTVTRAAVTEDTFEDPALESCLVRAARAWSFSLSNATFDWSVVVVGAEAHTVTALR